MAAYLAEHVPHLQSLHVLLGLPPEALQSDQAHIEAAIKNAVTSLIRNREGEVDAWRDAITEARRSMVSLGRALGEKGREVVTTARRESESIEALPLQHERLVQQRAQLEKEYDERLERIETLRAQVDKLAVLLGSPFEPAKPLQQIAGPSRIKAAPPAAVGGKISSSCLGPGGSSARRISASIPPPVLANNGEGVPWLDVGDEVIEALQTDLQQAIEEREIRLQQLLDQFRDLLFMHVELVLPPIPMSQPHHLPIQLLPSRTKEERPGAHAGYEKVLSRYISANAGLVEEQGGENEENWSNGLEGVEPEVGLLSWSEEVSELWAGERDNRMSRIQALYDQLEPLWTRLEVEQNVQDLFIDMNRGCGEAVIRAYEAELARCLDLRRTSLSSFVVAARKEIELLWDELMLSEDEKGDFGAFIDDEYTEELLQAHEDEAERLRIEIESKATILPKVREWHALKADEEELERNATNPNRFSARGGAMLREEKLRKRVGVWLPKVEEELLKNLPVWEEANGRPFMVSGERVVDRIYDAREAKEAAKEAKKRAKQGLAPAKVVPVRATPGTVARSQPQSTISRKREAPTPTPLMGTVKRQKVAAPPSSLKPAPTSAKPRIISNPCRRPPAFRDGSSPTPNSGLPRAVSHTSNRSVSSSTAVSGSSASTDRTRVPSITLKAAMASLSKAEGRMPRRESFKPRQSVAGGLLIAAKARRSSVGWGVVEEDDEGGVF